MAQALGFGEAQLAVEDERLCPGEQVLGDQDQLEPDLVVGESVEGKTLGAPGLGVVGDPASCVAAARSFRAVHARMGVAAGGPTQRYLRDCVRPGDPVDLTRAEDERFEILHDGRVIGRTSVELSAGLRRFGSLPLAIEDVRVDCLRSAAGDPARTTNLGIGSAGFWLAPELVGFGRPVWKDVSDG